MGKLHWINHLTISLLLIVFVTGVSACGGRRDRTEGDRVSAVSAEDTTSDLTFSNITLEQSDDEGQILWQMEATQAVYSQDRQTAQIDMPSGKFFKNNEPAISVEAERGDVIDDGEQLFLRGSVVATDLETGAVLEGDEMEWRPNENVLIIRDNVAGTHPEFNLSADEATALIGEQQVELRGNIIGTNQEGDLRLEANQLTWFLEDERVVSDRSFKIQRLENRRVIEQASADQAEFNLATQIATLTQNGLIVLQSPPIRVTGNLLIWNLDRQTVAANQPITIVHQDQQTTIRADRGQGNLNTEVFNLMGNVRAVAQRNQSQLSANQMTWNASTQRIEAEGDVRYRQVDPVLTLRGPRAVGKLADESIVVSGGRVVTEIIPETLN